MIMWKFSTAINCMDGRAQMPVIEHLRRNYGVDYIDMITEPGPNKILSEGLDKAIVESIKKRVEISIARHDSKMIALAGHHDCAGNPAEKEVQWEHILAAVQRVKAWSYDAEVVGLWVNENWEVCDVK